MNEICVLQLGTKNWEEIYRLPECAQWTYAAEFTEVPEKLFDVVFLDRQPGEQEYEALDAAVRAYTLFVTENVLLEGRMKTLYECKCGQVLKTTQLQKFLSEELKFYFMKSYGEKFRMTNLRVAENFSGTVKWNGNHDLVIEGDFGDQMSQVAFWRNNIPLSQNQVLDLWLEYRKDPQVEITLEITQFARGSLATAIDHWIFDERQMEQVVHVEGKHGAGSLLVSLRAKGTGMLQIIALHDRYSRGDHGCFIPGGIRHVTSKREEIFAYFDPGDRKPPLNVYFSGYRRQEGFEGYNMMRKMGCPFLLFSDARLEGGCFYMGSEEYEEQLDYMIRSYMIELDFTPKQVILSGLSMGSSGALYYGSAIHPHAVIVGKPLANIGNVAANEKRIRPGGFPTSLDVLQYLGGGQGEKTVSELNQRFWKKFDAADWSRTKFVVAYMYEDDYDAEGYATLLEHLQLDHVQVYGKGIHGRHNDDTQGVVQWFLNQYYRMLAEDFGREVDG